MDEYMIADSYWVIPKCFLAGEYPGAIDDHQAREKLRWLLQNGVSYCLDLTEPGESGLKPYRELLLDEAAALGRKVIHARMPIKDFSTPRPETMRSILDCIDSALGSGHVLYVHCFGGVGRTGMVVGCYLVRHGMEGLLALEQIAHWRRGTPDGYKPSPETAEQRSFVLNWSE